MVEKIEEIVKEFVKEWKKSPYLWGNEIDVQVELTSRIKTALRDSGQEHLKAKYKGYKETKTFSRLCCEPPIYYEKNGSRNKCFPDIVVFDAADPNNPPDEENQKNWPMLWVCEIKYQTEWGGDFQKEHRQDDRNKVEALLRQKDGTKFACILNLQRTKKNLVPEVRFGNKQAWRSYKI